MDTLQALQQQRAALVAQPRQIDLQIEALDATIKALETERDYELTGLRPGDVLLMTAEVQQMICHNNRNRVDPTGEQYVRYWPVDVPVTLVHVYSNGELVQVQQIDPSAAWTVGGVPVALAQAMRQAYLAWHAAQKGQGDAHT